MEKIKIEYLNELDDIIDDILLFIDNCKDLKIRFSMISQIILIYDAIDKKDKKIRIKLHNSHNYDKRFITVRLNKRTYVIDKSLCVSFLELLFEKLNLLKDYIKLEP